MYGQAPAESEPQLLIAAPNPLSRAGLSALLEERGCQVLAQSDGSALQHHIERHQPDALVIDLGWQGEALRQQLQQIESDLPVLALTAADERPRILRLLQTLQTFPHFALLPRDSDPDAIAAAVDALAAGLTVLEPRLAAALIQPSAGAADAPHAPLTARENQVLQLLARGLTNRAIAAELEVSQHTVKFHVNAIMGKLNAQSRTEAVVRATQLGLLLL